MFLGTENALAFAFTQFLLTIPVGFVNFSYFRTGFKTLFSGAPNMDSLIAIGSGAAVVSRAFMPFTKSVSRSVTGICNRA